MKNDRKHENYELLNLIGYGLAKFDKDFIAGFGFTSKSSFYNYLIEIGICKTVGTIKSRQDMLDPFFSNNRKGWWQKKDQYISRKLFIDSLFGDENVDSFVQIVKLYLHKDFKIEVKTDKVASPILKSRFKQLQDTGLEAELFFLNNYSNIENFRGGIIQDARLFGDGYDFQIEKNSKYYLAEVKGVRNKTGTIRLTRKEFEKASEYKSDYILVVVSNLIEKPKITSIQNPIRNLQFQENSVSTVQISYHTKNLRW